MSPRRQRRFRERYGPWAVVTGASSGIGRALASELAALGLNVVLAARTGPMLQELADELRARHGTDARPVAVDLARGTGVSELAEATRDLDAGLLVAAAGFGASGPFVASPLDAELEMLAVNCAALAAQAHHFAGRFAARGRGGLVLLSSIVAFQGAPHAAHYAATKAYVHTLAEGLYRELAPRGVDVLACAPGPTRTGFAARARMTMGAAASPESVARATLAALGSGPAVVPGALAKVLRYSLAPLPRWARVRVMGAVMGGMVAPRPQ